MITSTADLAQMAEASSAQAPHFNMDGLIPAIATDAANGVVLMLRG